MAKKNELITDHPVEVTWCPDVIELIDQRIAELEKQQSLRNSVNTHIESRIGELKLLKAKINE